MFNDKKVPFKYKIYLVIFIFLFGLLMYGIKNVGSIGNVKQVSDSGSIAIFMANSYRDYQDTESENTKQSIRNSVKSLYPDINPETISNNDIKEFYIMCIE